MNMKIRYPHVWEFECDGLQDLIRAYPSVRHGMIPIKDIHKNKSDRGQIASRRAEFLSEVSSLVSEIKSTNSLDAILIVPHVDGRLICADGHHRLAACEQLGMKEIPAVIMEARQ